jgi:hypothetical protein
LGGGIRSSFLGRHHLHHDCNLIMELKGRKKGRKRRRNQIREKNEKKTRKK